MSKRDTFKSREVSVLSCTPGNFDHECGEEATIITLAHDETIEPIVITLRDTRTLAVGLLVSLCTAEDEFASKVLHEMFPADSEGQFQWPDADTF